MTSNAHELGATVGAWNALVRRARIGRERKAAALVVSSYARANGTGIHCGVARIAVDLEVSHRTARRYLAWLRDVGLIELVRPGNRRRGRSDEYRLILGPDVLEAIEVPDPEAYKAMCQEAHDARNGSPGDSDQGTSIVSPDGAPSAESSGVIQMSPDDVDQGTSKVSPESAIRGHPGCPPISPVRTTSPKRSTSHADDEELRTDVAVDSPPAVVVEIRPGASQEPPYRPPPRSTTRAQDAIAEATARRAAARQAHRSAKEAT